VYSLLGLTRFNQSSHSRHITKFFNRTIFINFVDFKEFHLSRDFFNSAQGHKSLLIVCSPLFHCYCCYIIIGSNFNKRDRIASGGVFQTYQSIVTDYYIFLEYDWGVAR